MRNFEELLPDIFKNYMKQLLGKDYEKYIDSLNNSSIRGIRINPIKLNNKNIYDIFPYKTSHVPYEKYGRI